MSLDQALLASLQIGLLLVQLGLLAALLKRTRPAPETDRNEAALELARRLGPALQNLLEGLQAERQQAAALVAEARELTERLTAIDRRPPRPPVHDAGDQTPVEAARDRARQLLAEGHEPAAVAAECGLPLGEVKILANLRATRATGDEAAEG